jgi:ABC-type transport system substrate-binding protein
LRWKKNYRENYLTKILIEDFPYEWGNTHMVLKNKKAFSRIAAIIIVVVVLVIVIGIGAYVLTRPSTTTPTNTTVTVTPISLSPNTLTSTTTQSLSFNVLSAASNGVITTYFGDGQSSTGTSVTHTYANPGTYLVTAQETINGTVVSTTDNSTRNIIITPVVNSTLAPYISIPVITVNTTLDPTAPVVSVNTPVYFLGGYTQPPSDPNTNIFEYIWNFGNGVTQTVLADNTTFDPVINPVNVTYTQAGIYAVSLTLVTENASNSAQTYSYTVEYTVAVGSSSQPYSLLTFAGNVPNSGVITEVENVPGGPLSFDPQIDYESVGYEVILNTMGTLLVYNGSSTSSFLPMLATEIPTVANGGINANYTQYTFTINSNLKFSNGNTITAYDVWYSMVRNMLFNGGAPGTPCWILSQYLIPDVTYGTSIMQSANDTTDYNAILNAITYNNATDTVTFNLISSQAPSLFFTALADPLGCGVLNAAWLQSVGAGITFSPAGFYAYQSQAYATNYNTQVQFNPVSSGPYQIKSYVPGQSVTLTPNTGFVGVPGIPAVNNTVVIQWVKDPETAFNLFSSGAADIVTGLPSNYFPTLKTQQAAGQTDIYQTSALSCFFYVFNLNTSTSLMKSTFGSSYNVPTTYFANQLVREAFAYAFNYSNYLDELVGNAVYGENFASGYCGVIINGLPDYVPPQDLNGVPNFNLSYATQLMKESGEYNVSVNIPAVVNSGNPVDFAAMQMWAAALAQMDPNIQMTPVYQNFNTQVAEEVPGGNPMPVYNLGWIADYPYPSDFVNAMYEQGGTYPIGTGWDANWLNATGDTNDSINYAQLNNLLVQADAATNATQAAQLYQQEEQIAINLYMYVYTTQPNSFWVVKPYMTGFNGQISYEQNPQIGGAADSVFYWWVKG